MTTLYQQITEDRKAARKAADPFKVTTLGTLLGEIQSQWSSLKVDERGEEPSDLLVGKIVINFVNNLKEFFESKRHCGRSNRIKYPPNLFTPTFNRRSIEDYCRKSSSRIF